ncbi:MAG TPA: hypothetical protein VF897_07780 [Roseiflexaceae bacterium]
MAHRIALLALLMLILSGCGAVADARRAAALRRWQARPIAHYLLRTREDLGGQRCGQAVEVRGEELVRIVANTCPQPNLWAVSWLFTFVAKAQAAVETCARLDAGVGCVCRRSVDLEVTYDPSTGIPREIVTRQTWRAAWQSWAYWRYVARQAALPDCTPPFSDPGHRVTSELQALP